MQKYITITGCPGTGKTTLLKSLVREINCSPIFEKVELNPYVESFYQSKNQWSLHLSIFYLTDAIETISRIKTDLAAETFLCQDYEFLTHYDVYCKFLRSDNFLSERDFLLCSKLNSILIKEYLSPDLIVFLFSKSEKLIKRLQSRNRLDETLSFDEAYLNRLSVFFQNWVNGISNKVCKIDTTEMNLESSESDRKHVLNLIQGAINVGIK